MSLADLQSAPLVPFQDIEFRDVTNESPALREKATGRISTYHTAWCGRCERWDHLESPKKMAAAQEAKRAGWKIVKPDGWVCPDCQADEAQR